MPKILPVGLIAAVSLALTACGAAATTAASNSSAGNAASSYGSGPATTAANPVAATAGAGRGLHTARVTVLGHRETIVVDAKGDAVYLLTGDSSRHPECTSGACLSAWPAVTGKATGKGIKAHIGVWSHNGMHQLTLAGHPLYTYAGDSGPGSANGEGIKSFGGSWYVLSPSGKKIDLD